MSFNLQEAISSFMPNNITSNAASLLGESENGIQKALAGAIPSLFSGLLSNTAKDGEGTLSFLRNIGNTDSSSVFNNLASLLSGTSSNSGIGSTIMGWIRSLLGNKLDSVIQAIASFAGIKSSSASGLLSLAAPALLMPLAKEAKENNWNKASLSQVLNSQKDQILNAVPAGFNLSSLGLDSITSAIPSIHSVKDTMPSTEEYVEKKAGSVNWFLPLLLILGIAAIIWFLTQKSCNAKDKAPVVANDTTIATSQPPVVNTNTAVGTYDATSGNYIYDIGTDKEIVLTDGTKLIVGENSTEARLFNFLNSADAVNEDKTQGWITLDRVYFETGKSVLTSASQKQLENISTILKAFPNAKVKLGGYTDKTGSDDANIRISAERAKVAMNMIKDKGIEAARLESEGYGPQHPVCAANDTDACKAQNRRVDIRVTNK